MNTYESKVVILGSQGVGKTSLIQRYIGKIFSKHTQPTIGASFFSCNINIEDYTVRLLLWDTAGQERFRSMNIWESLKCGIQQIQKKTSSHLSFEELYRSAYTIVLHRYGEIVYNGLQSVVAEHLDKLLRESMWNFSMHHFLQNIAIAWEDHQTTMAMIRDVLMYVDRVYVAQNNVENVYNVGLKVFREQVVDQCASSLQEALIDSIMRERNGEVIDRLTIKSVCQMLMVLGLGERLVYENVFESQFLIESANFYKMESQTLLSENSVPDYVRKVEQRINEEVERVQHYLDPSTEKQIISIVEQELIKQQLHIILEMGNSCVISMLKDNKTEDLACLYKIIKRVDGLDMLVDCAGTYLKEEGKGLVAEMGENKKDAITFIKDILHLRDSFAYILNHCFEKHPSFQQTMFSSFEYFMNLNPKCPEYLSLYIDAVLRKDDKEMHNHDIEQSLDKAMMLFKHISDKDVFERYYKQHLAKRLLLDKIVSDESEKSMISKLKTECGFHFTTKFEGMFKDMHVSRIIIEEFKMYSEAFGADLHHIDLSVNVLTAGIWPTHQPSQMCILPTMAAEAFGIFRQFYFAKHSGRQLTLQPNLGFVDLTASFFGAKKNDTRSSAKAPATRKYVLSVSTYQMCILMLFNKGDSFTFQEIRDETNIPEKDLLRCLQPLALGKLNQRILVKTPKTKDIENTHSFSVNDSFTSQLHRIKVKAVSIRGETSAESAQTMSKVENERRHEIEAAIVRVMKDRKVLSHNLLIAEVTEQLKKRFLPKPENIKKRIEALIDRDYLKRATENRKVYHYVS